MITFLTVIMRLIETIQKMLSMVAMALGTVVVSEYYINEQEVPWQE
jgi:hypothetical protein